ncbi:hypothetical protein B2G71_01290 [Novosphingobium sp. PC22D]|uniref:YitT family protein n=1 Tax=Novosphingobium sp. PC22D TaxID=1962403 RepID=UPI000BF0B6ED|nr:YitT family protein [Novosphingobium sp. PC22D]PEQ14270.1 hypothetical protein B2G71_01290 [Novosphingobium sp. PC22D]
MHGTNEPASIPQAAPPAGQRHGPFEDAYAIFVGTVLLSLGLVLLKAAGLATGGVAGLALTLAYLLGWPVGLFYVVLTVPLLALTVRTMRWAFILKTLLVSLGLFAMTLVAPYGVRLEWVHPAFAAIVGGSTIGMGALALARHGAGTGGSGAIVLWLYRKHGWNAGRTQMVFDASVLLISLAAIDIARFGWSLLGVAATAGILWVWHRPGRYTGY